MEGRIRDRYSQSILDQAREAFGIDPGDIEELGGFESYIYQFKRGEEEGILRIAHSIRRIPDQIRGELDFIHHLKSGGASVAGPLLTLNEDWVAVLDDGAGDFFVANAFEKAAGKHHKGEWSQPLLFEYGRQIGLMHNLATMYQPSHPAWKRLEWDDPVHLQVGDFIPEEDQRIKGLYHEVIETTQSLPRDRNSYGLIHQDAHQGNFFVDGSGRITIFDFDDSSYSWFVEDIALVLFYAVMGQEDPAAFTAAFLKGFLPGYFSEFDLDPKWFREIPLFMKRREIDLYAVIHRSFDVENLDDPWCIWYLEGRKERLDNGIPYLAYDFEGFDLQAYLQP